MEMTGKVELTVIVPHFDCGGIFCKGFKCTYIWYTNIGNTFYSKGGTQMKAKLLAAIFGTVLVLGACGGGGSSDDDKGADTGGDTAAVDVEKIVDQKCISCHGRTLEGGSGPALDKIGAELSEEEIHDVIINGQGTMPPNLIQGEEADAVAAWLAEKK